MNAATGDPATARVVYILYLVSIAVGITAPVGAVMAWLASDAAPEWIRTHYRFQIRTFWIGLLLSISGSLLTLIIVGWLVLAALLVWLIARCVKGLQWLERGEPVPDPATWTV